MNRFQTYRPKVKRLLARVAPILALFVVFMVICLVIPYSSAAFQPPNAAQIGQRPNPNAATQSKAVAPTQETWRRQKKSDQGYEAWGRNWRWYFGVPEYGEK
jgi:hypothetical protein